MATLVERLDKRIQELGAEKQRVKLQHEGDLLALDRRLDALRLAKRAITPEVEAAYLSLRTLGLVKEI